MTATHFLRTHICFRISSCPILGFTVELQDNGSGEAGTGRISSHVDVGPEKLGRNHVDKEKVGRRCGSGESAFKGCILGKEGHSRGNSKTSFPAGGTTSAASLTTRGYR